jgi:hypothetical protein
MLSRCDPTGIPHTLLCAYTCLPLANHAQQLLKCLSAIAYPLWLNGSPCLLPILMALFIVWLLSFEDHLYIPDTGFLSNKWFADIFSICMLYFYLQNMRFQRAKIFNFSKVHFLNVYSYRSSFWCRSKK